MKRFGLFVVAVLLFGVAGAARSNATDLIVNGVYDSGVTDNGGISYGNEIDAVSLMATPEPSTLFLFASGLGLLFFAWRRQRALPVFSRL